MYVCKPTRGLKYLRSDLTLLRSLEDCAFEDWPSNCLGQELAKWLGCGGDIPVCPYAIWLLMGREWIVCGLRKTATNKVRSVVGGFRVPKQVLDSKVLQTESEWSNPTAAQKLTIRLFRSDPINLDLCGTSQLHDCPGLLFPWYGPKCNWTELGLWSCHRHGPEHPMSQPCHLPEWQQKHGVWHKSAEHFSADLGLHCCHRQSELCPMSPRFHLPKTQQKVIFVGRQQAK